MATAHNVPERHASGLFVSRYTDDKINRVITADYYRETSSQSDPERDDKRHLDERDRHSLIKHRVNPPLPMPDEAPMQIDFVGGME